MTTHRLGSGRRRTTTGRGRRAPLARAIASLLIVVGTAGSAATWAQNPIEDLAGRGAGAKAPSIVDRALAQSFRTDDERRDLRIAHGRSTPADLDTPAHRARAALSRGAFDDASLSDPSVPALDRAEALLHRGQLQGVLDTLSDPALAPEVRGSVRAARLRTQALDQAGLSELAAQAARPALEYLVGGASDAPGDIVEAVRAVSVVLRTRGPVGPARAAAQAEGATPEERARAQASAKAEALAGDFQALMDLLARARSLDPLLWSARVAEAELLMDKDNFAQAEEALREALALNPRSAEALGLLAQMAVSALDLGSAQEMAARLDRLSRLPALDATTDAGDEEPDEADAKREVGDSALGALVRARAMLRQNDPELSDQALRAGLVRWPERRDLLAMVPAIEGVRYDFEAMERELAKVDASLVLRVDGAEQRGAPAWALLAAGKAVGEARQYAQAAGLLARARDRAPNWSAPVIELGLLEMQAGRDGEALDALTRAEALDPFNVRAGNSLKLLRELMSAARVEGEHFVVRARPGVDALLAREMLPTLERMHAVVTGAQRGGLRHEPPTRTLIDLSPDHARFAVRITGMSRLHTIAASTGPVIAMEVPRDGRGHSGAYDWERVVRHEYAHTVGLSRTGNRIPHWFTEAQAVYLELSPRDFSTCQLLARVVEQRRLFDLTAINLAFARPERPTDRAQAYAQGHWMLEYIIERAGDEAPLKLMDLYAKGVREEAAFQQVLGVSREAFVEDFKVWARVQLVNWGMWPADGTPRLSELVAGFAANASAPGADPQAPPGDKPAITDDPDDPDAPERDGAPGLPAKPGAGRAEVPPAQIDAWLEQYPDHPELLEVVVRRTLGEANNTPTEAMRPLLERYAKARPVDPMPRRHLARLALAGGRTAEASELLAYLDAREDKSPTYAVELAKLHARAGELALAGERAERATRLSPYSASVRELAAAIAVQRDDYATARRHIEFLIALEPDREIHAQRLEALERKRSQPRQ
jgi:tetratricopeptide (TPR) repeat protein